MSWTGSFITYKVFFAVSLFFLYANRCNDSILILGLLLCLFLYLCRDIFNALSKSVTNLHDIDASNTGNNGMGVPAMHSADSPAIRTEKKEKKVRRGSKSTTAINPKK